MTEEIKPVQDTVQGAVQDVMPEQLSNTYEATAIAWLGGLYTQLKDIPEAHHLFAEKHDEDGNEFIEPSDVVTEAVIRFAHHLDAFTTLDTKLEILALREARKIDREFMTEMIEELGLEKAKEIARRVNDKHNMGFNEALNKANETTQSV